MKANYATNNLSAILKFIDKAWKEDGCIAIYPKAMNTVKLYSNDLSEKKIELSAEYNKSTYYIPAYAFRSKADFSSLVLEHYEQEYMS